MTLKASLPKSRPGEYADPLGKKPFLPQWVPLPEFCTQAIRGRQLNTISWRNSHKNYTGIVGTLQYIRVSTPKVTLPKSEPCESADPFGKLRFPPKKAHLLQGTCTVI